MAEFVIGLDQGSTASKALLVNHRGKVVHTVTVPCPSVNPGSGRVEIDPDDILTSQLKAFRKILSFISKKNDRVAGVGIASQRSTFVLWDRKTGQPLTPVISWQDRRAGNLIEKWRGKGALIRRRTGLMLTPYYSAPKIRWLLDRSSRLRALVRKGRVNCGTVNTYLIWHLTRGKVHATDPTNGSRMLLMNLARLKWDPVLLDLFKIPASMLPELRDSIGDFGMARMSGWEIPIRASIGDQQSGLLGLGAVHRGDAVLNYGTGGFFIVNTGCSRAEMPGILDSVGWTFSGARSYIAEGTVNSVGSVFDWLIKVGLICSKDVFGKKFSTSRGRPYFVPAFAGLGAPHWESQIRTGLLGIESGMTGKDLARAAGEGIAFLFRDIIEVMERVGKIRIGTITASGGGSNIPGLLQLQADIIGKPIRKSVNPNASGLGAAVLAGIGAGWWSLPDQLPAIPRGRLFRPRTSGAEQKRLHLEWKRALKAVRMFS